MNKILSILIVSYCLTSFAQQQIINLTTGTGSIGAMDPIWTVKLPNNTNAIPIISNGNLLNKYNTLYSPGYPVDQCGKWISPFTITSLGPNFGAISDNSIGGEYFYSMNFTAWSNTVTSAQIFFSIAGADDVMGGFIYVNGNPHSFISTHDPLSKNVTINIGAGEIVCGGLNTIKIRVYNGLAWTGLFICGSLKINYAPLSPTVQGNAGFCSNAPLVFTGDDGTGFSPNSFWEIAQCDVTGNLVSGGFVWNTWTGVSPGVYTFPANLNLPCNNYYRVKLAVANNCQPWVETTKVIFIRCSPVVSVSGPQTVCSNSGVVLSASGANTYLWTPTNQTGGQVIVHPGRDCAPNCSSGSTLYTVKGTNSFGCTSTATIAILPLAQNLSIDISTGVGSSGLLPFGTGDPDWKVRGLANVVPYATAFSGLANSTVVQPNQSNPVWISSTTERWITSKAIGNNPDPNAPATLDVNLNLSKGYYWYENRFTIPPNVGYSNFQLNVPKISADNDIKGVYLNSPNALTTGSTPSDFSVWTNHYTFQQFYGPYSITNQSKFKEGENVLQVSVYNLSASPASPTGLIMRGSVLATCPIIEPCLPPVISVSGGTIICPGTPSVTLSLSQYSSGTIQWEKQECNGSFIAISGATSSTYIVTMAGSVGTNYRVKITCNGLIIYSNIIVVYQLASCSTIAPSCGGGGGGALKMKNPDLEEKAVPSTIIYPNPFNSNLTAIYSGEGEIKIEVIDVLGKIVLSQQGFAREEINLKINDIPSGMYIVKIVAEGNLIVKRVIKE